MAAPLLEEGEELPRYERKHVHSCKNNNLCGLTLRQWAAFAGRYGRHFDVRTYWPRLLFLTAMAALNSLLALVEGLLYAPAIARAGLGEEAVFVIGHPRTGTTHVHNLLSCDAERFAFASTFQCGFPGAFLWLERAGLKALLAPLLDKTRPMDNMALHWDLPQEDELALVLLTAGLSPYLPIYLMPQYEACKRFFSFREARPAERATWLRCFDYFCRKLVVADAASGRAPRTLLLKSPAHTARIALLRERFPRAKFVYVHRNPYEVFQSATHMADTTYWYSYLSTPTDAQINHFVLDQYETLHREYVAGRRLLPPRDLVELRFEELDRDPVGAMRRVYAHFGWEGFDARVRPRLDGYLRTLGDFKKNAHKPLSPGMRRVVARRWRAGFLEFGYPMD